MNSSFIFSSKDKISPLSSSIASITTIPVLLFPSTKRLSIVIACKILQVL
ncbi:MAG: hypothetical protein ACMXYB_00565 [Candidatus Woesearchaeota archaeon]